MWDTETDPARQSARGPEAFSSVIQWAPTPGGPGVQRQAVTALSLIGYFHRWPILCLLDADAALTPRNDRGAGIKARALLSMV